MFAIADRGFAIFKTRHLPKSAFPGRTRSYNYYAVSQRCERLTHTLSDRIVYEIRQRSAAAVSGANPSTTSVPSPGSPITLLISASESVARNTLDSLIQSSRIVTTERVDERIKSISDCLNLQRFKLPNHRHVIVLRMHPGCGCANRQRLRPSSRAEWNVWRRHIMALSLTYNRYDHGLPGSRPHNRDRPPAM